MPKGTHDGALSGRRAEAEAEAAWPAAATSPGRRRQCGGKKSRVASCVRACSTTTRTRLAGRGGVRTAGETWRGPRATRYAGAGGARCMPVNGGAIKVAATRHGSRGDSATWGPQSSPGRQRQAALQRVYAAHDVQQLVAEPLLRAVQGRDARTVLAVAAARHGGGAVLRPNGERGRGFRCVWVWVCGGGGAGMCRRARARRPQSRATAPAALTCMIRCFAQQQPEELHSSQGLAVRGPVRLQVCRCRWGTHGTHGPPMGRRPRPRGARGRQPVQALLAAEWLRNAAKHARTCSERSRAAFSSMACACILDRVLRSWNPLATTGHSLQRAREGGGEARRGGSTVAARKHRPARLQPTCCCCCCCCCCCDCTNNTRGVPPPTGCCATTHTGAGGQQRAVQHQAAECSCIRTFAGCWAP